MKTLILFGMALGIVSSSLYAQPAFLTQTASKVVWVNSKVTFAASTSAQGPTTFHWLFNSTNLPSGLQITTMAGNGTNGYAGDGGLAISASLNNPYGVTLDAAGDLLIADTGNGCIRRVDTNDVITTVAGNGTNGYSGDGGAATNAMLNQPRGVAVDAAGDLFIADMGNVRIRKVDTNGIITTIAGNGTYGYSGDGGPATNAMMYQPLSVVMDGSGDLFTVGATYETDGSPGPVRKIDTNGIITTIAGNGTYGYSGDGGAATNAELWSPRSLAVDALGDVFIADHINGRIRKVDTHGIITTFAGGGSALGDGGAATNAYVSHPLGLAVDPLGNVFFGDNSSRVREVNTNGIITTVAGNGTGGYGGDDGIATNASLSGAEGVTVDAADNLFFADTENQRVREVVNAQWPNAMKSSLVLNPATLAKAGNYQEIITANGGSATNNVFNLTVVTSPLIYQTVPHSDGGLALSFVSPPGSTNVVLVATNLWPPVLWQPISTNVAGADGDWQFTDVNSPGHLMKFYRSLTQ